jgi:PAS domain S-box-containing protein
VALVGLAMIYIVQTTFSQKLTAELTSHSHFIANHLSEMYTDDILTMDYLNLQIGLIKLKNQIPEMEYAFIMDNKGRLLAHTFEGGVPASLIEANNIGPDGDQSLRILKTERGDLIDVAAPVLDGEAGVLRLGMSGEAVRETVSHLTRLLVMIIAAVLLVGLAAVYILSTRITGPIIALKEAATAVGSGDLDRRVNIKTRDETGQLASTFNRMTENLKISTAALTEANAELEKEIAMRIKTELELERYTSKLERYTFRLEESEERFRNFFEGAPDAMLIADPETGIILDANPAASRMMQRPHEEIVGLHQSDLHPRRMDKHSRRTFKEHTQEKKGMVPIENFLVRPDGTEVPIEILAQEITFKGKTALFGTFRDITERKRAESITEALNVMNNIGYVFSGIRHEIGNPINSIKTALNVLSHNIEKYSKEETRTFLDRTLEELGRVEYLLRSLKSYNMFERPELQKVDLSEFMEKFLAIFGNDFRKKGIRITTTIHDVNKLAYADPRALNQVMLNILTNASDALEDAKDPEVVIAVDGKTPGTATISVRDNGRGMSEEQMANLFRPFHTSKEKGTGLGLVIVRKMLTKMNGTIAVKSRKDAGTTVEISIPTGKSS